MTDDDRNMIWAYRLILAEAAENEDAFQQVMAEITAADGCWACLAQQACDIAIGVLYDRYTDADDVVDTKAVVAWIEFALDTELDHIGRTMDT